MSEGRKWYRVSVVRTIEHLAEAMVVANGAEDAKRLGKELVDMPDNLWVEGDVMDEVVKAAAVNLPLPALLDLAAPVGDLARTLRRAKGRRPKRRRGGQ